MGALYLILLFVPIVGYLVVAIGYWDILLIDLEDELIESQGYREVSLTLVGIIFSGIGISGLFRSMLPAITDTLIFFLIVCLTSFLFVFYIQKFRIKLIHDFLSDLFLEIGLLSLLLSIAAIIFNRVTDIATKTITVISFVGYFTYMFGNLMNYYSYLKSIYEVKNDKRNKREN